MLQLSGNRLKKKIFLIGLTSFLIFLARNSQAQLIIDNSITPAQGVQDILLGPGITVSSISFTGDSTQIGFFNAVNTNLGLDSGLILASGNVNVAIGPNNDGALNMPVPTSASDPDLLVMAGAQVFDAAVLEFDFIPVGDSLHFEYIFASEEYPEFACSDYNDAFGFFISGPGFNGPYQNNAENIALISGTNTQVAINTITPGVAGMNGDPLNCAAIDPNWTAYNAFYVPNGDGTTAPFNSDSSYIQFDGYTTVLSATASVQCGQTYHIKLAISDVFDSGYDSGIFLKARSFVSPDIQVSYTTGITPPGMDSTIVEGCTSVLFSFTRLDSSSTDTVYFNLGGNADPVLDFVTEFPSYVIFPQGSFTQQINVTAVQDTIFEGTENMLLNYYMITTCGDTINFNFEFYITDDYPLNLLTSNDTVLNCPPDSLLLFAQLTGGIPFGNNTYSYSWNDGQLGDSIYIVPSVGLDTFIVTAMDSCALQFLSDTIVIDSRLMPPGITIIPDTVVGCVGETMGLFAFGIGGDSLGYIYSWSSGESSDSIFPQINVDSTFFVTVTALCSGLSTSDSVSVVITPIPPLVSILGDSVINCGDSIWLSAVASGSNVSGYEYLWSNGSTSDSIYISTAEDTSVSVNVTAMCNGLQQSATQNIEVNYQPPVVQMMGDTTSYCIGGELVVYANASDSSGYGLEFLWSSGSTTLQDTVFPISDTTFYITVTELCGNTTTSDSVSINFNSPVLFFNTADGDIFCEGDTAYLYAWGASGGTPPYTYNWSNGMTGTTVMVTPLQDTSYQVSITDACGFTSSLQTVNVTVTIHPPLQTSIAFTQPLCPGETVLITTSVSGGTFFYNYNWSTGEFNDNISVSPMVSATYSVTISDDCGTDSVLLAQIDVPTFSPLEIHINDVQLYCPGDQATFNAYATGGSGNNSYSWTWSGGFEGDSSVTINTDSSLWLVAEVSDFCFDIDSDTVWAIVTQHPSIDVTFSGADTICIGDAGVVFAHVEGGTGTYDYHWSAIGIVGPSNLDSIILEPFNSSTVELAVEDDCNTEHIAEVFVPADNCTVQIPNVFTPNNDGFNELFYLKGLHRNPGSSLLIFNRWGQKVYFSEDYPNDWDGDNQQNGVYFYVLTLEDGTEFSGTVTLIR